MVNVAMIGVGDISGIYLKNITEVFHGVRLVGVCDLIPERAEKGVAFCKAQREKGIECHIPRIYPTMFNAFNDPEVDVILNLTRPYEHYEVSKQALLHGKHVYSEKPLAADMAEGDELVELAKKHNLYMGGAPDTFMGAGIQTCRKLIDDGMIGDVVGSACFMICHGHETWHHDPAFYYQRGGGPMMDMGPYYLTALLQLMGEVKGVTGVARKSFDERLITSQPYCGQKVAVEVDTHITGTLHFASGAIGTILTTFDVHYPSRNQARFEVYGTKGTLLVPDPNTFGGPVRLLRPEDQERPKPGDPALLNMESNPFYGYRDMPLLFDYRDNSRALGLADMCQAIQSQREARCNYRQQHHVLDIMTSIIESSRQGRYLPLKTRYTRTAAMKNNPMHGVLDA
jgi:predicted dehydrogenase